MKDNKAKVNRFFAIAVITALILSILLIILSLFFDDYTGEWTYNKYAATSIIVPGYPVILLFVASAILFSCGQLRWKKTAIDWEKYKWCFGITCFLFVVVFLPKLVSAIFNLDGLDYDDRWQMIAESGTCFTISSYVGTLITKAFNRKKESNHE